MVGMSIGAGRALATAVASALLSTNELAQAGLPKEGSIAITAVSHSTIKRVAMGEEIVHIMAAPRR